MGISKDGLSESIRLYRGDFNSGDRLIVARHFLSKLKMNPNQPYLTFFRTFLPSSYIVQVACAHSIFYRATMS
jgi:hypothetical protein